jgi:hypothetical protein
MKGQNGHDACLRNQGMGGGGVRQTGFILHTCSKCRQFCGTWPSVPCYVAVLRS